MTKTAIIAETEPSWWPLRFFWCVLVKLMCRCVCVCVGSRLDTPSCVYLRPAVTVALSVPMLFALGSLAMPWRHCPFCHRWQHGACFGVCCESPVSPALISSLESADVSSPKPSHHKFCLNSDPEKVAAFIFLGGLQGGGLRFLLCQTNFDKSIRTPCTPCDSVKVSKKKVRVRVRVLVWSSTAFLEPEWRRRLGICCARGASSKICPSRLVGVF